MQQSRNYWKPVSLFLATGLVLLAIAHAHLVLRYNANQMYIVDFANLNPDTTTVQVIDKGEHCIEWWHNGNTLDLLADSRKAPKVLISQADKVVATVELTPGRSTIDLRQLLQSKPQPIPDS